MAEPKPTNRLAREVSPYLRQHMHDPVDWFPWGPEAFEVARASDRPILLSVGYAACHWCHVMEHDAFEVPDVAELMNRHFVSIKVDREERPDIDQVYQGVVQLLGRGGGWPLTVFLTPEGRPFFGGTYFPPADRFGLPGFRSVLSSLAEAWKTSRAEVEQSSRSFQEGLAELARLGLTRGEANLSALDLVRLSSRVCQELDRVHGGFFGAPKFPNAMELSFLLRVATGRLPDARDEDRAEARHAVELSLSKMARGGLHDQLGGGFHRYSVDARWAVPHFEKMLYDNALLLRLYAEAAVALRAPGFADVARDIAGWLGREMVDPGGGFFSTQDADSEGVEGKFFVWTRAELDRVLGQDLAPLAAEHLGVTPEGNFEGGTTVLHVAATAGELAARRGEPVEAVAPRLSEAKRRLLEARHRRVRPATDDKVLAGWNGLAIGALAAAGRLLGAPALVDAARRAAAFVLDTLVVDGRLQRVHRAGVVKQDAFLDDHAQLAEGLVELFESTGEARWLDAALGLSRTIVERFWDEGTASFALVPRGGEALIAAPLSVHDNALPSGASSAVTAALRLFAITGDEAFGRVAEGYLTAQRDAVLKNPFAFGHLLCAAYLQVRGIVEVAVIGRAGPRRHALLEAARRAFRPEVLAFEAERGAGAVLEGKGEVAEGPAAYLCRAFACEAPVTDPAVLAASLGQP